MEARCAPEARGKAVPRSGRLSRERDRESLDPRRIFRIREKARIVWADLREAENILKSISEGNAGEFKAMIIPAPGARPGRGTGFPRAGWVGREGIL